METSESHDVVICGGGLAGLTLGLQLHAALPAAKLVIIEKQARPLPIACHKVGESCVELGAHYLGVVLGLKQYLLAEHLIKNGLRFYCGEAGSPVEDRREVGPAKLPIVPSYQLDRGKLENDLRALCDERGIELLEAWSVHDIELGAPHKIAIQGPASRAGTENRELRARWVVDATGRRQLLQRKLGLRRPTSHNSDSAWFRVAGRVTPGDLVPADAKGWHERDLANERWLSTNHLMGRGYWVWLIPLSTGHTSIGIVTSQEHHAFSTYNTQARARSWLEQHEPALASRLQGIECEDFRVMGSYGYSSERILSADRWACVGEAGLFVDPLYSPGTDVIAVTNTLTTTLIEDDLKHGRLAGDKVEELQGLLNVWLDDARRMLTRNGVVYTHGEIFAAKLWWDYFHYWNFTCQYYFQGIFRESVASHARFREVGQRYFEFNERIQSVCEAWADLKTQTLSPNRSSFTVPLYPSVIADAHVGLQKSLDPDQTLAHMRAELVNSRDYLTELLLLALHGVGLENAARFAQAVDLASWIDEIDGERIAMDQLSRRERVDQGSRVARDIERVLGRFPSDGPSSAQLIAAALATSKAPK